MILKAWDYLRTLALNFSRSRNLLGSAARIVAGLHLKLVCARHLQLKKLKQKTCFYILFLTSDYSVQGIILSEKSQNRRTLFCEVLIDNRTWNSVPFSEHMCCGRSGGCSNVAVKMYLLRKRQECSSTGVFPAQGDNICSFCPMFRPSSVIRSLSIVSSLLWFSSTWCNLFMCLNKVGSTTSLSSCNLYASV